MKKFKRVIVTIKKEYLIPMDYLSSVGGSIDQVMKRWFKDCPIWSGHATRDCCEVGHSDKAIRVNVLKLEIKL